MGYRVIWQYRCDFCDQVHDVNRTHPVGQVFMDDGTASWPPGWQRLHNKLVCPLHRVIVRSVQDDMRGARGPDEPAAPG